METTATATTAYVTPFSLLVGMVVDYDDGLYIVARSDRDSATETNHVTLTSVNDTDPDRDEDLSWANPALVAVVGICAGTRLPANGDTPGMIVFEPASIEYFAHQANPNDVGVY